MAEITKEEAEALVKAAEKKAKEEVEAAEAKAKAEATVAGETIKNLQAELAAKNVAYQKVCQELAEHNAKILSL